MLTSGEMFNVTFKCIVWWGAAAVQTKFERRAVVSSLHSTICCGRGNVRKLQSIGMLDMKSG